MLGLLVTKFKNKLGWFVIQTSNLQEFVVDALVTPLNPFSLTHAFPPMQSLPSLLHRIKVEGIPVIMITTSWPRKTWYAGILSLRQAWALPDWSDLLLQRLFFLFTAAGFDSMAV